MWISVWTITQINVVQKRVQLLGQILNKMLVNSYKNKKGDSGKHMAAINNINKGGRALKDEDRIEHKAVWTHYSYD